MSVPPTHDPRWGRPGHLSWHRPSGQRWLHVLLGGAIGVLVSGLLPTGPGRTHPRGTALAAPPPIPTAVTRIAAHRGAASAEAPEQSLAAFQHAAEHGYIVELDLQFTRDHVPIAVHDPTPDRTAICTGPPIIAFGEVSYADLTERCTLRGTSSPSAIPTWSQVLDAVRRGSPTAQLVVELKSAPGRADLAAFTTPLQGSGLGRQVVVNSFVGRWASAAVDFAAGHGVPGLTAGLLTSAATTRELVADGGASAAVIRAQTGPRTVMVAASAGAVTAQWVGQVQAAGLAVWVWTVDSPRDWLRLRAAGVDVIITNRPAAAWAQWMGPVDSGSGTAADRW